MGSDLQDNPSKWWPEFRIAAVVEQYVENWNIDGIVTFDDGGVSGHINHRAVSAGIEELLANDTSLPQVTTMYELVTVNLMRKYMGIADSAYTLLSHLFRLVLPNDDYAILLNTPGRYFRTRRAFKHHASQLVWDRWIYMIISRYEYYVELKKFR